MYPQPHGIMTKTTKHNYSSYWLDDSLGVFDDATDTVVDRPKSSVERIMKLASIRRAVANFVRILTSDDKIQVKFSSGKNSYTDGKTVVISADDDPKNFDSMVGLALHEGSHCLLSDFDFLNTVNTGMEPVFYGALHPDLRKMFPIPDITIDPYGAEFSRTVRTLRRYLLTLMNVVEDRRIDSYVYQMAPGYRPYYDALYKRYFFSKDVEKNLLHNPDWRVPTVENYVNWLLMIFSPHFKANALPGLKKMVKMIDLPNIRKYDQNARVGGAYAKWKHVETVKTNSIITQYEVYDYDQFSPLWKVANELLIEILKRAKFHADENGEEFKLDDIIVDMDDIDFENDGELPNLDVPQGNFNVEKAKKALEKMKDALDGKMKKKKLKRNEEQQISSMESAAAKMEESSDPVFGKIPCLVTRKFTKEILLSQWFEFTMCGKYGNSNYMQEDYDARQGVIAGIKMGQILTHRLQVRNDPTITHFTRQQQGKIDRRILSQLGMDIETVFKRTTVENFRPAMLHLSLDASGSMGGTKWQKVITVATALAYTADKVRNLDVVITLRGNITSGIPTVAVVYDSRVDNFHKVRQLFPYLSTSGSTPEGLCYAATMELIQECASTHSVYFINFSDGEPGCHYTYNGQHVSYSGPQAYTQTKNMVRQMREAGVRIMSYFISESGYGHSKVAFTEMYGQDAEFVNVKNVTQVLKTLNKLLLARE